MCNDSVISVYIHKIIGLNEHSIYIWVCVVCCVCVWVYTFFHDFFTSTTDAKANQIRRKREVERKKDHFRFKYVIGSLETGNSVYRFEWRKKTRFHIEKRLLKLVVMLFNYNLRDCDSTSIFLHKYDVNVNVDVCTLCIT